MLNSSIRKQKQINSNLILKSIVIISLLSLLMWALSTVNFKSSFGTARAPLNQSKLILSGALSAHLDIAEKSIACNANNLEIFLPATNGLNGYRISLADSKLARSQNNFSNIDSNFALELIDQNNTVYSSFFATDGELYLNAQYGSISGFVVNEHSEKAYISLSWICPKQ